MLKTILHLCADIGSDTRYYQLDPNYRVILIGKSIGVENFFPTYDVHGVVANPVCTDFSTAQGFHLKKNLQHGLFLVEHCLRIIKETKPLWYVIENPANGVLRLALGEPNYIYQPWQYGSPWTKKTALWGNFTIPKPIYNNWKDVPKIKELYVKEGRSKPSLADQHKSALQHIPEMKWAKDKIDCDADLRSFCSQGFAKRFYEANP